MTCECRLPLQEQFRITTCDDYILLLVRIIRDVIMFDRTLNDNLLFNRITLAIISCMCKQQDQRFIIDHSLAVLFIIYHSNEF